MKKFDAFKKVGLACLIVCISSCGSKISLDTIRKNTSAPSSIPPAVISSNVIVSEEAGSSFFEVKLDHSYSQEMTVKYSLTYPVAEKVEDFSISDDAGTLTFSPGETTKTIPVTFHNDKFPENSEVITLTLSEASVGSITNETTTMTITDSDSGLFGADVNSLNQITGPSHAPEYKFSFRNTLLVDPSGAGGAYTTIQSAVNAATPGSQILLNTGVYPETVSLASLGNTNEDPIIIKANVGQTPIISGADEVPSSSITNLNTDGEESGTYVDSFESGNLGGFTSTVTTGNSAGVVEDSANSYMGTHAIELAFGGTTSQAYVNKSSFTDWDRYGSGGNEYHARVMFKLNSVFALEAAFPSRGLVVFKTESTGNDPHQFNVAIFSTADPEVFTIRLLSGTTVLSGSANITRGSWVRLQVYYKKSSGADGIARMSINGNIVANVTNHTFADPHDRYRMGSSFAAGGSIAIPAAGSKIYFDNHRIEESDLIPAPVDEVAQTIYEDGFETNLSAYNSTASGGNGSVISSSLFWDGANAARMTFAGSSAHNSLKKSFTSTSNDIYARVAFRLNANFDLSDDAAKVSSPSSTNEITKEFDLLSLSDSTGAIKRLKVSLLKRGSKYFIIGKMLNIKKDKSGPFLSWTLDSDIQNYLLIYKGHSGEIKKSTWNTIELRYAGDRSLEGGVELWLNGVSIASNINRSSQKYDGLSTKDLKVGTVELGSGSDNNTGVSAAVSMQTTAPISGSIIDFDGLKVTAGAPAGFMASGASPTVYQYTYLAPGVNESAPATVIIGDDVLTPVSELGALAPGTFYTDTLNRKVAFRLDNDAVLSGQKVYSGRRNYVFNIQNSSNIIFQNLKLQGGNNEEVGCFHMARSLGIKIIGNTVRGCNGAAVRVQDIWNASSRSSDILISGNTFKDNGKIFGGGVRLDQMGDTKILNNYFSSSIGNGIDVACAYSDGGSSNLTTNFCKNIIIARNVFAESIESAIYLTSNIYNSRIYSNIITGARESGYAIQTTNGVWRNSGGSGLHIARGGHNNYVYNNLIYNIDRASIALRAAVTDNVIFNNTTAESGIYIFSSGASIDFQRDYNEVNGAHNDPTKNNKSYNNIYSYTYSTNACVDIEGYNAGSAPIGSAIPNGVDVDNMSDHNIFYNCARLGKYNSTSYTDLATFVTATTNGATQAAREGNSQIYSGTLFTDYSTSNYVLDPGAVFTKIPFDTRTYIP
jgi:hypothetical protein